MILLTLAHADSLKDENVSWGHYLTGGREQNRLPFELNVYNMLYNIHRNMGPIILTDQVAATFIYILYSVAYTKYKI